MKLNLKRAYQYHHILIETYTEYDLFSKVNNFLKYNIFMILNEAVQLYYTVIKLLLCSDDEQTAGRIFARRNLYKTERNRRTGFKCSRLCQVKKQKFMFCSLNLRGRSGLLHRMLTLSKYGNHEQVICYLHIRQFMTLLRLAIRRALTEFIEIERNIPTINHILLLGTEFSGKSAVIQLIQNYCDVNWPRDDLLKRYVTIIRRHVFRLIG